MIKIVLFLAAICASGFYFSQIESSAIANSLVCLYDTPSADIIMKDYFSKFQKNMPNLFPVRRFESIIKSSSLETRYATPVSCNHEKHTEYRDSFLYDSRMSLHPLFGKPQQTMRHLLNAQANTKSSIAKLAELKLLLAVETNQFVEFQADCLRLKNFRDQVQLLEVHLKFEKLKRTPSGIGSKESAEINMSRNINRQLSYARKHLSTNHTLFVKKWKKFLDFENEGKLCAH